MKATEMKKKITPPFRRSVHEPFGLLPADTVSDVSHRQAERKHSTNHILNPAAAVRDHGLEGVLCPIAEGIRGGWSKPGNGAA